MVLPLRAAQLEEQLCQQVSQTLGQSADLLRWSLTAVDGEQVWAEVVATTNGPVDPQNSPKSSSKSW
ncbi:hypothetical protein L1047_14650 [Synechococcus sp. Nb3U1]|nr:hypothetical protein [Synechococcus sp. Nb3U1]